MLSDVQTLTIQDDLTECDIEVEVEVRVTDGGEIILEVL